MAVKDWSTTPGSNTGILTGITLDGANMNVPLVDDSFREMAAQIAAQLGKMNFAGADMASAATLNLATATGWYIAVTGTTTITALGTVAAGQVYILRFAGALTLTHSAIALILPGAANIVTAANDVAVMVSLGGGAWRCISYQPANGAALGLPTASTDNAIARYDGATGKLQNSGITVSDANALSGVTTITASGGITGATVSATSGLETGTWSAAGATVGWLTSAGTTSSSSTTGASHPHYRFYNANGLVGNITVSGATTAFNTSSDERLKENFRAFDSGEILDALRVYRFDWKAGGSGYGVKAQECQSVFPEAVTEGGDDPKLEPWSADYARFVPLLIAEVQSLRGRVAELESANG